VIARKGLAVAEVKESIDVKAPLETVYNQWTQFEEFPRFMKGVESVRQLDDTHLHWIAEVGGRRHEWDAEITYQEPDRRVAWRAVDGKYNAGEVTFQSLGPEATRVNLSMMYEREGIVETIGGAIGADDRRIKSDLERFRELIEERGVETGGWRGEVEQGDVQRQSSEAATTGGEDGDGARERPHETAPSQATRSSVATDLSERDDGRSRLLADDEAEEMLQRWERLQMGFVDEPREKVKEADDLVDELMQRLTAGFNDKRSQLEKQWDRGEQVSTEDLRIALTRYRSFFKRLLSA
jgi:uncharacterized membrane protein